MTENATGPLYRSAPTWTVSDGDIAADVGADLGLDLDEDQRWSLDAMFAEDHEGLPAAGDFCVVGPRQTTGKSAVLEVAAIADVTVFGHPVHIWTAHEFKTARKTFVDMKRRLKGHRDYADRCTFRDSHGEEAIHFDGGVENGGSSIEFHARSGGSGRGFTTGRITMDEALYVQPGDLGALVPTLVTIPDAQVRYGSSAGKPFSGALRSLRKRGRAGGDSSLAYIEHGAPVRPCTAADRCTHELADPGCALNDEDLWRRANPGLRNGRVTLRSMIGQRKKLEGVPREFSREFLSWWEDPPHEGGTALDPAVWAELRDPGAPRGTRVAFGVATAPDRSWSAIAVAWRRPDGAVQVQLVDYRPGAEWVRDRYKQLRRDWGGKARVNTAAKDLIPGAAEPSEGDQAKAHNTLGDAVKAGTVRHGNEPALNMAVRAAQWKPSGNTQVLDQKGDADISPLIAAALAMQGVANAIDPLSQIS